MKFHKGDVVMVNAIVFSTTDKYYQWGTLIHESEIGIYKRYLFRREVYPWKGMVIGFSFRQTGEVIHSKGRSWNDYEPGKLIPDKYHFVYLVEPLNHPRWKEPSACFPDDLDLLIKSPSRPVDLLEEYNANTE